MGAALVTTYMNNDGGVLTTVLKRKVRAHICIAWSFLGLSSCHTAESLRVGMLSYGIAWRISLGLEDCAERDIDELLLRFISTCYNNKIIYTLYLEIASCSTYSPIPHPHHLHRKKLVY